MSHRVGVIGGTQSNISTEDIVLENCNARIPLGKMYSIVGILPQPPGLQHGVGRGCFLEMLVGFRVGTKDISPEASPARIKTLTNHRSSHASI